MMNLADLGTVLNDARNQILRAQITMQDEGNPDSMKLARGHAIAAYNLLSVFMALTEQEADE